MKEQVTISKQMLAQYLYLHEQKKEIEKQLDVLKKAFNQYFDEQIGKDENGELTIDEYKIQRQIRKVEKYLDEETVEKLDKLQLQDLIVRKPDVKKIKSALQLGLLAEKDIQDCRIWTTTKAIIVKKLN